MNITTKKSGIFFKNFLKFTFIEMTDCHPFLSLQISIKYKYKFANPKLLVLIKQQCFGYLIDVKKIELTELKKQIGI